MRLDFLTIDRWVSQGSRVLDLGCGNGDLLHHLNTQKNVHSLGVEIDADKITACVNKGVNVIEQDIDRGLTNFSDNSFDTVLLTQTLQAVHRPDYVLQEMLRVGKECIITFPNFGYWQARMQVFWRGKMPVSKSMPYQWYDTPNIHFCTIKDFEVLCAQHEIHILDKFFHSYNGGQQGKQSMLTRCCPNLIAMGAMYHVTR